MLRNPWPEKQEAPQVENDIAQICLNGHIVNEGMKHYPQKSKKHCSICGEATLTFCENCQTAIQGRDFFRGVRNTRNYEPPRFCHECGKIYPWTRIRLDAARELADELNLSNEEKEELKRSLENLVQETPRTQVAVSKFKRLTAKAGPETVDMFKSILVGVVSTAIQKLLFPG